MTSLIEFVSGADLHDDYMAIKVLVVALVVGITVLTGVVGQLFFLLRRSDRIHNEAQKLCTERHEHTYEILSAFRSVALAVQHCSKKGCPLANIEIPEVPEV